MEKFYINVKSDVRRKKEFEKNNKYILNKNHIFKRFCAITPKNEKVRNLKSNLLPLERSIFLSHYELLKQQLKSNSHLWVCEDDTYLDKHTFNSLNKTNIDAYDWDIIFTDVGIGDISNMLFLFDYKKKTSKEKSILIDLTKFRFFCANSYIINKNSKKKLLEIYEKNIEGSVNYMPDLFFQKLTKNGLIKSLCFFPFISFSNFKTTKSGVHNNRENEVFLFFKKLMYHNTNLNELNNRIDKFEHKFPRDNYAHSISRLIGMMLNKEFSGY
tara:strand:- start:3337 stop:4149 length:813 start_codon:yes stop_codon:yes gene_type:complete